MKALLLSDRVVLMTNGPNPRYNHYRHEVLRFLYEKQRKLEPLRPRREAQAPAAEAAGA
jgi:nitrate/nitrite transport system ATP-binding protein